MPKDPLSVLTVTTAFPNPAEPGNSPFVAARLRALSEYARIRIIAPVPLIDYSNPKRDLFASRAIPRERNDGPLEIFHPRWIFPPLGTPANVPFLSAGILPLARRLHRQAPACWIDSHFGYPDGVAAALVAGVLRLPFSITIRGNELVNARYRLRRQLLSWAFRRASRIIAVSEELRTFAISLGVDPAKAVTIPNGVDSEVFGPRDRETVRANLGLSPASPMILTAGGLGPGKGHHLLVQSMPALLRSHPGLQLWIAGSVNRDGRYETEIRALIASLALEPNVRLLGSQPPARLADLMSAADLFTLASFSEGWPNVVHEALACGTPVVATRVGAIPQMLPSDSFGSIVPPGDVPALTEALDRALRQTWDRAAISLHGRARSWRAVAMENAALIRDALKFLGQ
jgi:teichuronic acid biosynthesis glycosyltransferase TuaC